MSDLSSWLLEVLKQDEQMAGAIAAKTRTTMSSVEAPTVRDLRPLPHCDHLMSHCPLGSQGTGRSGYASNSPFNRGKT